ncbi:alpha-2 adrenergic receptor [Elysia marginata]|uniref:Alpha-2 adrenergic receptor n=1 Tax=Elysia marginata TaxID=1093978 RepID=A0AAV4HYL6_9GAST|nr:alpha-2 adrenergic receptor [Elysia marginata]
MNGTPSNHVSLLGSSTMAPSSNSLRLITESEVTHVNSSSTSPPNLSDAEKQEILEELNYQRMQAHIPAMVMISFLMLIGLVGNSLVVYVYKRRFKKTSSNYFIMTMAIFDLLACLIGMPTELYDLNNPYTFYSTVSCKILRGCEAFTVYGSAVVLVEIAFDRFFKICRPLLRVSLWRIKILCVLAVVMAALLSIVPLIIYGIEISDTPHPQVKGHDCSFAEEYKDSFLKSAFMAMLGALVSVILIILLLLYIKIWWEIRRRRTFILGDTFRGEENGSSHGRQKRNQFGIRYMPSLSEDESLNNSVGSPNPNLTSMSLMEMHLAHANSNGNNTHRDWAMSSISPVSSNSDFKSGGAKTPGPSTSLISNSQYYSKGVSSSANTLQHQHSVPRGGSPSNPHYQHSIPRGNSSSGLQSQTSVEQARPKLTSLSSFTPIRLKMTRTTVVLFAVTVAFVLSYLPTIAVMMIKTRFESLDNSHDFTTNMLLKIFSNSFFINNAINPIIYSFLNVNFRRQAKNTFRHIFCCCFRRRRLLPKKVASDRSTKREFLTRD